MPAIGAAILLEEVGEGGAGVALGGVAVLPEGGEGGEVGFYRGVGGLERKEGGHAVRERVALRACLRELSKGGLRGCRA